VGEKPNEPFPLSFDASLKVDFQRSRITFDAGLVLVGELDERLRFGELIALYLTDSGRGKNMQLPLADRPYPWERYKRQRCHLRSIGLCE
jgi:hypothetical protein